MNITEIITALIAAIAGGGFVSIFLIPEKKAGAKLDNAERLVSKYEEILKKYEARIMELEQKNTEAEKRIDELEAQVRDLESKLQTMQSRRGKDGRFVSTKSKK